MPKVTVFAHSVSHDDDSIKLHDEHGSVFDSTDLLFVNETAPECGTAIAVLRDLATACFEVIDYLEARKTALLLSELAPFNASTFPNTLVLEAHEPPIGGSIVHDPTGRYPDAFVPDRKPGE